jgi:peptidyl-prolyl cis-trans isomerase C
MKLNSQKTALLLVALLAAQPLAGRAETTNSAGAAKAPAKPLELFANEIVAQGKGVKITRAMLDEALVNIKASAAARGQQIPPQQMQLLEAQVLGRLIGMQLLNGMATAEDKKAGAEAAGKQFELIKKNSGGDENFTRQLKTVGMTVEDLNKKLTDEATAEAVLQREIKFEVSDEDVKKFYEDNPNEFEQPERVRAAHILVGTRDKDGGEMSDAKKKDQLKLANDLLKRVRDGEDFAKLAKEYSDDPGSKDKGGEYTFPRGQMVPEFEATAFGQQPNQISDVVTTQFGYHIIKTLEKFPAKKVEFEKAAPDIKQYLKTRGMQKQIPPYMTKLEKAANVEILDADLKKITSDFEEAAEKAGVSKTDAPKAEEKK